MHGDTLAAFAHINLHTYAHITDKLMRLIVTEKNTTLDLWPSYKCTYVYTGTHSYINLYTNRNMCTHGRN